MQTKPDNELIKEIMCNYFKEWGYTVEPTNKAGYTNVYIHHKNIAFVTSLLKNKGFKKAIVKSI